MGEWEPKGILDDEDVRMRLRIMHAVDKSLDQIKVTDLCEKSVYLAKCSIGTSIASTVCIGGGRCTSTSFT